MAKTIATIAARAVAGAAYLAAAITMLFAYQSNINGFLFKTNFRDWRCFLFFAIANFVAGAYNIFALCIPSGCNMWRTVVLTDMVVTTVLLSSLAVSSQTYHFLYNGSMTVGWAPICNIAHRFCNVVLGSLVVGALGLLLSFGLVFYSLHVSLNPLLLHS